MAWKFLCLGKENTVIQTCIVACYGVAYSGGFSTYLLAMDQRTSDIVNAARKDGINNPADIKNPGLGWIIAYVFAASFLGLVAVVPLRKILIIDYKLTYPSGTATAVLINSFFTPQGYKRAQKQIKCLGQFFSFSFFFSLFKWHFSGPQGGCGFDKFPSLGIKAYDSKFYFDFNMTYIGAGMICPHIVNFSLLFGGIVSWGILWPVINRRAGDWYPASATGSNLQGVYGYKVFIAIALILGDGVYNFVRVTIMTILALYQQHTKKAIMPFSNTDKGEGDLLHDERIRTGFFLQDRIPIKVAGVAYIVLAGVSLAVILKIFHEMKWYYVVISYCVAPILGFCNAYGSGLTDWSLISSYGKLFLFIFSAWAGREGGIIVGLVSCGLMMVIVSSAADLMQDFKTGYLTLASPRSMLASQVLGTVIGCIVAPATFWMFWKAFPIGQVDGEYPAPYAVIFREMAMLGVEGFSTLPRHCLLLSFMFFVLAIVINVVRNWVPKRVAQFIPIPMAMALPFYIGSYFAIDMCIGSIIVYTWRRLNPRNAEVCIPAVASGLMCGDGMWTLVSAILALAKRQAPICMYFISSNAFGNLKLPSY
ncbi:hypothetical protein GOP47_0016473 [Adiantum capillus-veneris]|uniref:Uncharacterized protein n=1 Tax=Adiantum capillus-veneris TaxID=13818 RepID=A0A9D4UHQ7_ADICA|nr:hypothetical protein GOP47_0016473 [Adiantum capillus-veneris]